MTILSHKKQLLTFGLPILALMLIGSGYLIYARSKSEPAPVLVSVSTPSAKPTTAPTPTSTPTPVFSKLTGLSTEAGTENLRPLAVMIENHPEARPQSGLGQADLVYEAIAEGGITRFMAVFSNPTIPVRVGPIRSARTYFLDFATELNALYAHVGGNMDALDQIARVGGVFDLNQFNIGEPVFKRDFSRNVALEHTMYSSTNALWNYAGTKKASQNGEFSSWKFQADLEAPKRPTSQKVSVAVSDSLYTNLWTYDPGTNSYTRQMAGSVHKDANTGKQITTKNIVIETVERKPTVTRINEQGWKYVITGSGSATIIQNGAVIKGTWKKNGTERTRYYDATGAEISFVTGNTWVHIVHPDSRISF